MLDNKTLYLLKFINGECSSGGYKVFSLQDLLSATPEYFNADISEIKESLSILFEKEYISVKYQDDLEICLMPLAKGRLLFENILDGEIEKSRAERKYFYCSLLGATVGGSLAFLLGILLILIGVRVC